MARKRDEERVLPLPVRIVGATLIILILPLPGAFFYAGTEWLVSGIESVPREFVVTYVVELGAILVSIAIAVYQEWRKKPKK